MSEYPPKFLEWLAKRTPNVRARILRMNPAPLDEGACLRGYHPHQRSNSVWQNRIGKQRFIRKHGREAWAALPRSCIIHNGHRQSVTQETVLYRVWMIARDHPFRRATRENGQWTIPA